MRPLKHVIISAGAGLILYWWARSSMASFVCFLSGVLIDIDHHLDYYLSKKKFTFRYKELLHFCQTDRSGVVYLIFHSYESLLVFWSCVYYFNLNEIWVGAGIGMTVHIICDQFSNPLKPLSYFMFYRTKFKFGRKYLFTGGDF